MYVKQGYLAMIHLLIWLFECTAANPTIAQQARTGQNGRDLCDGVAKLKLLIKCNTVI